MKKTSNPDAVLPALKPLPVGWPRSPMLSFGDEIVVLRQSFHVRRNKPKQRAIARFVRQALVLLACLSATAYFAYHARYGRHGFEARGQLLERTALLDFEIKSLNTVRSKLERDVALLTPELPNPDIVEEIAREVLGYVHPNDRIVPLR